MHDSSQQRPSREGRDDSGRSERSEADDRHRAGASPTARERHARERQAHGGIKWGAAFFGWLTATGAFVLLTALLGGVGAVIDSTTSTDLQSVATDPQSVGALGAIVTALVLFLAYLCGGYVAGRMARFNGLRQGVAVWIWAIVIALVAVVAGYVTGQQSGLTSDLGGLLATVPSIGGSSTISGIIAAAVALLVALLGAVLGGLAGMRFHRRVDRTELAA